MTEPRIVRLRATARSENGTVIKQIVVDGEPELVRHHLLHVDGVDTVHIEELGPAEGEA